MKNLSEHISEDYSTYVRPWLGELLKALKLDLHYTHAIDNQLIYEHLGIEHRVLDFLGGYGANIFGHYHPRLKARMQALIDQGIPIQAQGSIRYYPTKLAQKLSAMNKGLTGHEAVVTLTNTGAETVEAAIKHACLARREIVQKFLDSFKYNAALLRQHHPIIPAEWMPILQQIGYQGSTNSREAMAFLEKLHQKVLSQPPILLALEGSFHGKTTGAVQLTHNPLFRYPMEPFGIPTYFIRAEIEVLEEQVQTAQDELWNISLNQGAPKLTRVSWNHILCCFLEPLQGEGGIRPLDQHFFKRCRELADQEDFVLILDEIQSGMGRTGSFYFSEQLGTFGDYYLLSKSLGGGLSKIGALIIRQDKYCRKFGEIHSSTFAEDELSAAIALESLNLLEEENLMARASELGDYLHKGLNHLKTQFPDIIDDVRGSGLMMGLEFANLSQSASPAIQMLCKQNLLGYILTGYLLHEHSIRIAPTLSAPRCLRLEPSVTITELDCDHLFKALKELCQVLKKANIFHLTRFLVGRTDGDEGITNFNQDLDWDTPNPDIPQIAFAGHFIQSHHMPLWDPGFGLFSHQELNTFLENVYLNLEPEIYDKRIITSKTGDTVQVNFIGICASSRQMFRHLRHDLAPMQKLLDKALEKASAANCQALGLGGYNSIVTANGLSLQPDLLAITTGNALTVGMGWRAIKQAAQDQEIDLSTACFAAIGATGNIASVYSELMSEDVPAILLIGRSGSEERLMKVAFRIYQQAWQRIHTPLKTDLNQLKGVARAIVQHPVFQHYKPFKELTTPQIQDMHRALQQGDNLPPIRIATDTQNLHQAQLILGASNAPEPLIHAHQIGPKPMVICDISIPFDTHPDILDLPHVKVIQGGVVKIETAPDFHIGGIPLENGLSFACMAETILMGLEGITRHYSYGRIGRKQVLNILEIADKHGFLLGRARLENSY